MVTIQIDETTVAGRRILQEVAEHPEIGSFQNPNLPRDEHGNLKGHSLEFFKSHVKSKFKDFYGVDYDAV